MQSSHTASEPLVTVVMATFNEPPQIIRTAIESVLRQTVRDFELLIYDDSTDEKTREAIDFFQDDGRVLVFRERERVGFVQSLNRGLRQARGDFIARMDGDDISYPDRFEKELAFLNEHEDISVVGGQIKIIDSQGEVLSERRYPHGGTRLKLYAGIRSPLAHPTVMMRRSVVEAGFFYDESLPMSEDLDLWLRLMNRGYEVANVADVVLDYRVAEDFAEKRTQSRQIECMTLVRRRNFSKKYFVRSALSAATAWSFEHMKVKVIKELYRHENRQAP